MPKPNQENPALFTAVTMILTEPALRQSVSDWLVNCDAPAVARSLRKRREDQHTIDTPPPPSAPPVPASVVEMPLRRTA